MKSTGFPNLAKPPSAEKKAAARAEREALALYEAQLTRMCWRKVGHLTEREAARKIARILKRRPGVSLRAYKCPACVFWHLTSAPQA